MAEVFIAVTTPEIIDENWPPKPAEPVRTDAVKESEFIPAPQPISNSDAAMIPPPVSPPSPPQEGGYKPVSPVSTGSTDVSFTPGGGPISNERGAGTIHGNPPAYAYLRQNNMPPPPPPITTNREVTFSPGSQPIQNDQQRTIAHVQNLVAQAGAQRNDDNATISNEKPSFMKSPPMNVDSDTFVPPPAHGDPDKHIVSGGVVNVGNSDVQILPPSGAPMEARNDTTIGGGGDITKAVRADEISIEGISPRHQPTCSLCNQPLVPLGQGGYALCDHEQR